MNRIHAHCAAALIALFAAGCNGLRDTAPAVDTPAPVVEPPDPVIESPTPVIEPPASVGRPQGRPGASDWGAELEVALKYFYTLRKLAAGDLKREHDAARAAFASNPSELNRIRFVLVLSLPTFANRDDQRALELLDPLIRDPRAGKTSLQSLALLLHAYIAETNKLASDTQALKTKLDALMSLEKNLTERGRRAPGSSP